MTSASAQIHADHGTSGGAAAAATVAPTIPRRIPSDRVQAPIRIPAPCSRRRIDHLGMTVALTMTLLTMVAVTVRATASAGRPAPSRRSSPWRG